MTDNQKINNYLKVLLTPEVTPGTPGGPGGPGGPGILIAVVQAQIC